MEKINIAEILKNCPQGMELDCTMWDGVTFEEIKPGKYPIKVKIKGEDITTYFTEFGEWNYLKNSKCVIFPKGKTTWEGFIPLYKFKEGDVIFKRNFIAIIHLIEEEGKIWYHCWFNTKYENYKLKKDYGIGNINDGDEVRLATEEEKAKLFKVIKENGYTWNAENKVLEKLMIEPKFKVGNKIVEKNGVHIPMLITNVDNGFYYFNTESSVGMLPISDQDSYELVLDKFDISTLKPFDKVLVRHDRDNTWCGSLLSHMDNKSSSYCYKFVTTAGKSYPMCIPYEGNEHLIGKTDDCSDFYKTWK